MVNIVEDNSIVSYVASQGYRDKEGECSIFGPVTKSYSNKTLS